VSDKRDIELSDSLVEELFGVQSEDREEPRHSETEPAPAPIIWPTVEPPWAKELERRTEERDNRRFELFQKAMEKHAESLEKWVEHYAEGMRILVEETRKTVSEARKIAADEARRVAKEEVNRILDERESRAGHTHRTGEKGSE
jgi:hypothetical protein